MRTSAQAVFPRENQAFSMGEHAVAVMLCRMHDVSSPVLFACLPGASAMQEPSGPFCRIWSASFGMGHAHLCQSGHSCHLFCHEVQKAACSVHGVMSKSRRLPCIQPDTHCTLVTARLANQARKRDVTGDWQHDRQLFLLVCCLYFRCVCSDAAQGPARKVQVM